MTRDEALKAFLQGSEMGGEAAQRRLDTSSAEALRKKYGETIPVSVGSAHIGGKDRLAELLGLQRLKDMADERQERAVSQLGQRVEKQDLPGAISLLQQVKQGLPAAGEDFKSVGGLKSVVPNALVPIAETVGKLTKGRIGLPAGAQQERAALEAAKLLPQHQLFGSALTGTEKQSMNAAFGAPIGASPEDIRSNLNRLESIPRSALKNIESSSRPSAIKEYQARGGLKSSDMQQIPVSSKPKLSFEEWKALKKAGKL